MEIVVVLVIALLVIGPQKLPGMAKSLGGGVREFKDSLSGASDDHDEASAPATTVSSTQGEAV